MVLGEQFLFDHKEETVGEEGSDQQNVPEDLHTLIEGRRTVSDPALLSAKAREEAPTIRTPTRARALPTTWLRLALSFMKIIEKMKVVTMVPPLIIW